jgi:VanZ family protein
MVPMLSIMGTIFFLSHQPGDTFDAVSFFSGEDKIAHFSIYCLLGFSVIYAFGWLKGSPRVGMSCAVTFFVCLLYGLSDEVHQYFIPDRSTSFADLVADAFGAGVALFIWLQVLKRKVVKK